MKLKQKIAEQLNISGKISHSACGEDIMLWRYFVKKDIWDGFFIDVGAYHPKFFNNTLRLRNKLRFNGINIDPIAKHIESFKRRRPDDINIQCAIGDKNEMVILNYVTDKPLTSGKNQDKMAQQADKMIPIIQKTLTQIVEKNNVTEIDLLDIDVEGTEIEVLEGYNWKIKPRLILIEDDKDVDENIFFFLKDLGYEQIAHTLNNAIYEIQL